MCTLENLFLQAPSADRRLQPVYEQARSLYLDLNKQLAEESRRSMMQIVESRAQDLKNKTGVPIKIVEDNSLESVFAVAEAAWRHKRDYHQIRYRKIASAITPHLIAHELEHLRLEEEARSVGRNRFFATTAQTREQAIRSISKYINKQHSKRYSNNSITQVTLELIAGLTRQLHSCPLDMVVEYRLYHNLDDLRPSQFVSLNTNHLQSLQVLKNKDIRRLSPPTIYRASVTLNYAYALFVDSLYSGATNYSAPYRDSGWFSTAQKLFSAWKEVTKEFQPGGEYILVDEFAQILKLQEWFEWKPDDTQASHPEGVTNPQLLKAKQPATVMYCLGALQRFENMSVEQIFKIGSEIGLLGTNGIDYTSPDPRHTLKSIPGERFTGLQLLCLMYVAFQIKDPSLDLGLDFGEAYEVALKLHKGKKS